MKHVEQIIENNGFIENIKLSGILFVEMWNSEFSSLFFLLKPGSWFTSKKSIFILVCISFEQSNFTKITCINEHLYA